MHRNGQNISPGRDRRSGRRAFNFLNLGHRSRAHTNPYERVHSETVYRPDIDGLRAISIFAVVGFHAMPEYVTGGYVGVDVFFVISGFLISSIIFQALEKGEFSFFEFYARRIRRIFPALFLVLSAALILGWFTLLADEYSQVGKHVAAAAAFVLNFVLRVEAGYFDTAADLKPLLHLWSLAIEEQFYLLWPAFLVLAFRFRPAVPGLILVILFASFGYNVSRAFSAPVSAFYFPHSRLWELLIGATLAYAAIYGPSRLETVLAGPVGGGRVQRRDLISCLGGLLIGLAIVVLDRQSAFPGWWALLPTLGTLLLIAAGPTAWANRSVLSSPILVFFGLISYPLYLWHWLLLSIARIHWTGAVPVAVVAGAVALSVILAWLTYQFFETPIRRRPLNQIAPVLACAILLVGVAGYVIRANDGIPSRTTASLATDFDAPRLDREHAAAIRSGRCHINEPSQTFEDFRSGIEKCLTVVPGKPNILVLGDSHAVDIWLTLSRAYSQYNFLQATGAGCDPSQEDSREFPAHCRRLLTYVRTEFFPEKRVDGIIFAARWRPSYNGILKDINRYRAMGMEVALFGPNFEYLADVPKILAKKPDAQPLAGYLEDRLNKRKFELDDDMRGFSAQHKIPYLSIIATLCTGRQCPVLSQDNELYIRDYGHWTINGVRDFGRIFADNRIIERLWPIETWRSQRNQP